MARIPIIMPKMSMTMTEGDVGTWMVKVGDVVGEGDVVCEVMTDKVDMEVESTAAGTLVEIVVEEGTVAVGEPIAWLEGEVSGLGDLFGEEDPQPSATALAEPTPDALAPAEPSVAEVPREKVADRSQDGPVAAVPRARGLAAERGIDLAGVRATGPDGLVTVRDVEAAIGSTARAPEKGGAHRKDGRSAVIRRVVARKMTESAAVPQFTVWRDIDLAGADARRAGLSWTTVLLRCYAAALGDVPNLMRRWEDDRAVDSGPAAIALAVATPGGLLVPVFREPDEADPRALDAEIKTVVRAASEGRVDPPYLGVANGSLSNLGGMGVDRFQALVTPPQASVLALGSIKQRPVAVPGGVGLALTLTAGLTVDHRVADGAEAAMLLDRFAERLASFAI